jgi:hypothetical protein
MLRRFLNRALVVYFAFFAALVLHGAEAGSPSFSVAIETAEGKVISTTTVTETEMRTMPQITVKVKEHEGEASYSGVSLHELVARAGAPSGPKLHGKALAAYVLATAKDGYQVVYTLTEMDPAFTDDHVIVADRINGAPLPEKQGPFRLVAGHDKKPARALRMLDKIEVIQLNGSTQDGGHGD